jgi:heme oxygenase
MSKLKELTWENHQKAERTEHARKLLKGMSPQEYHRYIYNQYVQYAVLESRAKELLVLIGIEDICRAEAIKQDMIELENQYEIKRTSDLLCPVVAEYADHVIGLTNPQDVLAHIYVRHFGDMYGGQMIAKRNPGSGKMYEFTDVETLKTIVRAKLNDSMADEANICFEFAMQLFEELDA